MELPGSQPRRFRKGKPIIISEEKHNMDEGCLPRRLVEFLPQDTKNSGSKTVGCKSPRQGLQGNGGKVPMVQYNYCSSSRPDLQPGSDSPATGSRNKENTSSSQWNPCDVIHYFFPYLLPIIKELNRFALSLLKLMLFHCQMALSLLCQYCGTILWYWGILVHCDTTALILGGNVL